MKKMFSGGAPATTWPAEKVVSALKRRFDNVDQVGEDGPLRVYGVHDNGVNFVVALMQTAPGSGDVAELGFLARFIGFPVSRDGVERLNGNLHISVATLEGDDLFLMAGMQVVGAFDESQFNLILEQWRRDLAVCLHGLSGDSASLAAVFPAAKMEAARKFASNMAPPPDAQADMDMLSAFLGAGRAAPMTECRECLGRGRKGLLLSRPCEACGGTGFVSTRG